MPACAAGLLQILPVGTASEGCLTVREKWCREARRAMSAEQTAVMRGQVPARLAAETAEMDMTTLPALDAAATASEKNGRFNPQIEGF